MLKISCLNDDRCDLDLEHEHGLSLYIEYEGTKVLFDVGQSDAFIKNANKLGLNISDVNYLVLSHGHYDHSDGLKYLDEKVKILCHPDCTIWRKSKRTDKYNGIPYSKDELNEKFDLLMTRSDFKISDDIIFLGEVDRNSDFECKKFPSVVENGDDDVALDDTGLVINTENGLVVISGCSHSGICNTIEQAKRLFNQKHVYCVVGGFHLKECDEQTFKTIEYMRDNGINRIILGHCTSDDVCNEFIKELSDVSKVEVLKTGERYFI